MFDNEELHKNEQPTCLLSAAMRVRHGVCGKGGKPLDASAQALDPGRWDDRLTALCPCCGRRFPFRDDILGRQIACPLESCGKPLQMNPFVVDGREGEWAKAEMLKR